MSTVNIAFAGNRPVAVECLQALLNADLRPVALLLPGDDREDSNDKLRALVPDVPTIQGNTLADPKNIKLLQSLQLHYMLSIHYPYIFRSAVLTIPTVGTLNLHPAFLPYNRGWHTPTWAIVDQTPFGVTLHWVDEGIDSGDIAMQQEVSVLEDDTAHSLYQRALIEEVALFRKAIPMMKDHILPRISQQGGGTEHKKDDIEKIRNLDTAPSLEIMHRIVRGCSTNNPDEAAFFEDAFQQRFIVKAPHST